MEEEEEKRRWRISYSVASFSTRDLDGGGGMEEEEDWCPGLLPLEELWRTRAEDLAQYV